MQRHLLLVVALVFEVSCSLSAQAPQGIQYQALIRDGSGEVVANQSVGLQLRIHQTTAGGTVVYEETHIATTNAYGLVNLQIGAGTTMDDLSAIDWSMGPYFVEVGLDLAGGSSYTSMVTTQLLSVPYALYAERANVPSEPGADGNTVLNGSVDPTSEGEDGDFYINTTTNEIFGPKAGGTWPSSGTSLVGPAGADGAPGADGADGADGNTVLNGSVDPTSEGEDGDFYINTASNEIFGPKASGTWPSSGTSLVGPAESATTYAIGDKALGGTVFYVNSDGTHGLVAANQDQYASVNWYNAHDELNEPSKHDAAGKKYFDWRLPTKWELNEMYNERSNIGGFVSYYYWSSTEVDVSDAWFHNFNGGIQNDFSKDGIARVRAVRAF
jgi:hypothetical protein